MTVSLSMLAGAGAQFLDDNGDPLSGGLLYTYLVGTTSDATTFMTSAGHAGGDNTNPIVLDAAGRVPYQIWLTDGVSYKFVLKTAGGATVRTYDNMYGAQNGDLSGLLAASSGSSLVGFVQAISGAVERTLQEVLRGMYVSASDFGVLPSASASDNLAKLESAISNVPDGTTIYFTPGTYNFSRYVQVLRGNIRLLGSNGVVINNTNAAPGYPSDGFRIGNMAAVEGEGGTNTIPYTYLQNVIIDGFTFTNCRIGVWFLFCRNFLVQNIQANSTAAVACGNDGYDDCDNFIIRNVTQLSWSLRKGSEDFYIIGIYRCSKFSISGVRQLTGMTYPANASSIDINESTYFSVDDAHLDQSTKAVNGITLAGCQYYSVDDCNVINAKSGFVTFPRNGIDKLFGRISNSNAVNCINGVQVYGKFTTFENVLTAGCTYDLALQTDAAKNTFKFCNFNPDGTASLYQEVPTGNNGINLQRWYFNTGIVTGVASGYYSGLSNTLRAVQSAGASNVTGAGAAWTVSGWTIESESNNGTSNFNATTGVYTAPITGTYRVEAGVGLYNAAGTGVNFSQLTLKISSGTPDTVLDRRYDDKDLKLSGCALINLNRGATIYLSLNVSGAAGNTVGIAPNSSLNYLTVKLEG